MAYLSIFYIAIVFMFSFGYRQNQPHALINYINYSNHIDLGLVALASHYNSASFVVFEVYFKQNNKNIIFTIIFATFYSEIAVKWSKSRIFEKFQLDHAKNTW